MRKSEECFIVVIKDLNGETQFCQFGSREKTLEAILQMTTTVPKHPRDERVEVKRVFKVDELGRTTQFELVIKGFKPVLKVILEATKDDEVF